MDTPPPSVTTSSLHALLLLSDSALPLGSFAFSSGLESFLAHHKLSATAAAAAANKTPSPNPQPQSQLQAFDAFLDLSLRNLASTTLPYVLHAYHAPHDLPTLDNDLDASTPCTVARRASISQGKALLNLWERALAPAAAAAAATASASASHPGGADGARATSPHITAITALLHALKSGPPSASPSPCAWAPPQPPNAHFPPLFGAICAALSLSAHDTGYLYLLNHAKSVVSAAVRAGVMGPYQAHAILAGGELQERVRACVGRERGRGVGEAGVRVPVLDVWGGRHECLYSRIFNS